MRYKTIILLLLTLTITSHAEWKDLGIAYTYTPMAIDVLEGDPVRIFVATTRALHAMFTENDWRLKSDVPDQHRGLNNITANPFDYRNIILSSPEMYFITGNFGESYQYYNSQSLFGDNIEYLKYSPWHQDQIYCLSFSGLFRSVDNGNNWKTLLRGRFRTVAHSAQDPDMIIAQPRDSTILKSLDGGNTWQATGFDKNNGNCKSLYIDPQNDDVLYAMSYPSVYRSDDGGESWANIGRWDNLPEATQVNDIEFCEQDPMIIAIATDKGVFITENGGQERQWPSWENSVRKYNVYDVKIKKILDFPVIYAATERGVYCNQKDAPHILTPAKLIFLGGEKTPETKDLMITNTGVDTLIIESIECNNPAFEIGAYESKLAPVIQYDNGYTLPGASINVPVIYSGNVTGEKTGTITIRSNALYYPIKTVTISYEPFEAGPGQMLLTSSPGVDQNPFLLKGRDGNKYLFWKRDHDVKGGIFWKKYENGEWSETMTVVSDSLEHWSPKAVMDAQGNLWVSYRSANPAISSYPRWITVQKYDSDEWTTEYVLEPGVNADGYGYNTMAIDAQDQIYIAGYSYGSSATSTNLLQKSGNLWQRVDYVASTFYQNNPQIIIPSTTNLPWLIYFFRFHQHGGDLCNTYADYLTESGEWQQIHINWPGNYEYSAREYDVNFYDAIADSQGNIYTGHFNGLWWSQYMKSTYNHSVVRQFDCITAEETGNWVLNIVGSELDYYYMKLWDYMQLCADKSSIGYTIYNTEEKQMYARKFDGTNWTIAQPVPGIDEKLILDYPNELSYTTLIDGNELMVCATVKINDDTELFMSTIEFNTLIDTTIKPLEYYAQLDTATTGVENDYDNGDGATPQDYALQQNYPNPFNPSTTITYALPKPGRVNISIYNMLGQRVATLVNGYQADLNGSVQWQGLDDDGQRVSSGIYFARMNAGGVTKTIKMALVK